jgi:hypothetical protein
MVCKTRIVICHYHSQCVHCMQLSISIKSSYWRCRYVYAADASFSTECDVACQGTQQCCNCAQERLKAVLAFRPPVKTIKHTRVTLKSRFNTRLSLSRSACRPASPAESPHWLTHRRCHRRRRRRRRHRWWNHQTDSADFCRAHPHEGLDYPPFKHVK